MLTPAARDVGRSKCLPPQEHLSLVLTSFVLGVGPRGHRGGEQSSRVRRPLHVCAVVVASGDVASGEQLHLDGEHHPSSASSPTTASAWLLRTSSIGSAHD